jgi:membrane-bound lytic murein transglycosylase MltF
MPHSAPLLALLAALALQLCGTARSAEPELTIDLKNNIWTGDLDVRFMADTYFADGGLDNLNKVLFAIASYNAGPNRIRELRKEAAARHLNPNLWFDNVERVVSEKIGRETVQYVSNIYKYYIAYTLVQQDVARNFEKANGAVH